MKPENRLHKTEKTIANEERAFKLRASGWSQCKIADKLGMTQQGVSKALKRSTLRFAKTFMADINHVKNEQVVQLEHIANEAIEAWYKSKINIECGDPRYLAEFRKAKADIRNILGAKFVNSDMEVSDEPFSKIKINIIHPKKKTNNIN